MNYVFPLILDRYSFLKAEHLWFYYSLSLYIKGYLRYKTIFYYTVAFDV